MLLAIIKHNHYNKSEVIIMSLKNRIRLCNSVDKGLFEKLQKLSDKTDIPMSKLLDKALTLLLEKYEGKQE
jgi:hypothetical protein